MDQAKWCVPRNRHVRATKSTAMIPRPRFKVHACWVMGICLNMFVIDPRVPSDASTILECAVRSIEMAVAECKRRGVAAPTQLIVWDAWAEIGWFMLCLPAANCCWVSGLLRTKADNCVRETKNNSCLRFLSYLTAARKMKVCALLFSTVGHTHGPLGLSA